MKMSFLKRTISGLLAFAMVFALAACSQQAQPSTQTPNQEQTTPTPAAGGESGTAETPQPESPEPAAGEGSKALVVYFSATGNTETVAGYIADTLGADTFEITPVEPYTSDDLNWNDEDSRVSREHEDPSLRTVELTTTTVDNWDSYDTVFLGYPIWWGIAAWPVDSFVSANDFTGKTVIPFCTSSSSGLGQSGELLADLAGTGDWLEGQRFSEHPAQAEVQSWLDRLGLSAGGDANP